jgi:hypothetical protein
MDSSEGEGSYSSGSEDERERERDEAQAGQSGQNSPYDEFSYGAQGASRASTSQRKICVYVPPAVWGESERKQSALSPLCLSLLCVTLSCVLSTLCLSPLSHNPKNAHIVYRYPHIYTHKRSLARARSQCFSLTHSRSLFHSISSFLSRKRTHRARAPPFP